MFGKQYLAFITFQAEQKPLLFLANAKRIAMVADKILRQSIVEPVVGLVFDDWRWVSYWYPLNQVIEFKREVYRQALKELVSPLIEHVGATRGS